MIDDGLGCRRPPSIREAAQRCARGVQAAGVIQAKGIRSNTASLRLRPPIDPLVFLFVTFAIGALAMGVGALSEAQAIAQMHWDGRMVAAIAYVAIFPSILAYMSFNAAVSHVGPGAAGQAISLLPLLGAVLAAMILGEPLFPYHLAGMALILGGVLLGWGARARMAEKRR